MKKSKLIYIMLIFIPLYTFSQESFYFDGYLVNLSFMQIKSDNNINSQKYGFNNLSRIRYRNRLEINQNINFILEHETSILYKNKNVFYSVVQEKIIGQIVNLHFKLLENPNLEIKHFIDRLAFIFDSELMKIVIGRQRISWGTGRIWRPTDLFNPITPTNFAKIEKDGVDALVVKYNLGILTDLSIVCNLDKHYSNYAMRFKSNFAEQDWSLFAGKFQNDFIFGGDLEGNFFNAGLRSEFIWTINKYLENYTTYILGIDYQFTNRLYTVLEYFYNGSGFSNKSFYNFEKLILGESLYLAKQYFALNLSYLIHPLLNLSFILNQNISDGSRYYSLNLNYSALENLNIGFGINLFTGQVESEYWYYPSSLIFKVEQYF